MLLHTQLFQNPIEGASCFITILNTKNLSAFRLAKNCFYFVGMMSLPKQAAPKLLIPKELNRNNFDLLRFLLAACVIYSHCFVLIYLKMEDVETLRTLTRNQVDFGGIAVSFFFAISGFLIVRSFEHSRSTYDYFVKRLLRILPGFCVAFLVSVCLFGVLGTVTAAHKWGDWNTYLVHLNVRRIIWQFFTLEAPLGAQTFLQNPLPNHINDSLWTIQCEFLCYMLVPLLGFVSMVKRKKCRAPLLYNRVCTAALSFVENTYYL